MLILVGLFINGGQKLTEQVNTALNDVTTTLMSTIKVAGVSAKNSNDLKRQWLKFPFFTLDFDNVKINADGSSNISEDNIVNLLTSGDDNDKIKSIQSDLKDSHLTSKKMGEKVLTALASIFNCDISRFYLPSFCDNGFCNENVFLNSLTFYYHLWGFSSLFPVFDV